MIITEQKSYGWPLKIHKQLHADPRGTGLEGLTAFSGTKHVKFRVLTKLGFEFLFLVCPVHSRYKKHMKKSC